MSNEKPISPSSDTCKVLVALRIRPFIPKEIAEKSGKCVRAANNTVFRNKLIKI